MHLEKLPELNRAHYTVGLLYTSDAADELLRVARGVRRIIKKTNPTLSI